MLEIQERFDTEGYEKLVKAAGDVKLHITEALDGGQAIGFIAYAYDYDSTPVRTVVYDYSDGGDLMLCDGLVRSVMFKSVLKGIESMCFRLPENESADRKLESLRTLRFLSGESLDCGDLDGFMNACEHCKNTGS